MKAIVSRVGMFLLVVWVATTLIFFLPRLAPGNPIQDKLLAQMEQGGGVTDIRAMVEVYNVKFGLDKPLWQQYFTFLRDTATLDLGQSIAYYPSRTMDMIGGALPWTIGLLTTTTVLGFLIGTILGALTVWRGSAAFYRYLVPFLMIFSAIPFYLIGLVLVYVFAYLLGWFPWAAARASVPILFGAFRSFWRFFITPSFRPSRSCFQHWELGRCRCAA